MSRISDYSGADADAAVSLLESMGIDPETVSLPCALATLAGHRLSQPGLEPGGRPALERQQALHGDCDGTRDAPRRQGTSAAPCLCPGGAGLHRAGHAATPAAASLPRADLPGGQ